MRKKITVLAGIGFVAGVLTGNLIAFLTGGTLVNARALEWTGSGFLFTVTGSGHGAGMSQYGANVMARQGSDFREILLHYYPGVELSVSG